MVREASLLCDFVWQSCCPKGTIYLNYPAFSWTETFSLLRSLHSPVSISDMFQQIHKSAQHLDMSIFHFKDRRKMMGKRTSLMSEEC